MKPIHVTALIALLGSGAITTSAVATPVQVDIYGNVAFNAITAPGLGQVQAGESLHISFEISTESYVVSIPGDINSYFMFPGIFAMNFSGGQSANFMGPAFFSVVDGFPVSDGFFVSSSIVSPGGIELTQSPYQFGFNVGYVGSTLNSTNLIDALGYYDFTGLTNYGFTIWAFSPDNVQMEIEFEYMTITAVPAPSAGLALLLGATTWRSRRRSGNR